MNSPTPSPDTNASPLPFNPMDPEFDRDPYPILAQMRAHTPVFWWPEARAWFLTRHEDVVAVLGDEERFSPNDQFSSDYTPPPAEARNHPAVRLRDAGILQMDGAQHTRIRKLAMAALSRRAVRSIQPLMSGIIDEFLAPVRSAGKCDFVADIASRFPVAVISRMLGIAPNSERERHFKSLADSIVVAFNPMIDEKAQLECLQLMAEHMQQVGELMEEKRRRPGDDLMSHLVEAEAEGERFTPDEIQSLVVALLVAGSETTANSMSFALIELLRHPDQMKKFKEDPACRWNAAYEFVRFHMPGRFLRRYAKQETEIRGTPIQAGQALFVSVASAQRDPDFIEDPDHFDITRTPKDFSAFGIGRHFCIGAQLAQLELEVSLGRIVEALPQLELDCRLEDIPYRSNPAIRGPARLPIRFDAVL